MRMIVLAAGLGSRLYPLTRHAPKSLLDLGNGTTLLESQLEAAAATGHVTQACIVTGYRAGQIEEWVRHYDSPLEIRTIYNPFFDTSNSLVSLWCAHARMVHDDFIVINGDTLFRDTTLMRQLIECRSEPGITLTVSRKAEYDDDDMKIIVNNDGRLLRVGKDVIAGEAVAESAGFALVRGEKYRALFAAKIVALLKTKANHLQYWHNVFNGLADDGVYTRLFETNEHSWAEFDFHPDISVIRHELARKLAEEQSANDNWNPEEQTAT